MTPSAWHTSKGTATVSSLSRKALTLTVRRLAHGAVRRRCKAGLCTVSLAAAERGHTGSVLMVMLCDTAKLEQRARLGQPCHQNLLTPARAGYPAAIEAGLFLSCEPQVPVPLAKTQDFRCTSNILASGLTPRQGTEPRAASLWFQKPQGVPDHSYWRGADYFLRPELVDEPSVQRTKVAPAVRSGALLGLTYDAVLQILL